MTKKFVVFIDTQVDFMIEGAALYVPGAQDLIGKLINFAYHLKPEDTAGILFTADTHYEDETDGIPAYSDMPESKQFPIHCVADSRGWQNVVNDFIVNEIEIPMYGLRKNVFNMWEEKNCMISPGPYEKELERDAFFDKLKADGIRDVVIVGVAADFCVKWAADGFLARGFNVEIPRSLTAGIARDIDTVAREDYAGANLTITD